MTVPEERAPVSSLTTHAAASSDAPPAPSSADPSRDLAGALHEVSNALTVVLGWIERARGAGDAGPDVQRALEVAMSRAAQARGIVRRAIGAEGRNEAEGAVAALVADALTGLDPELRRAELSAHPAVAPAVSAQHVAHASSVLQILTNLLLNATAMAPRGSVVRLEAMPAGDRVVFAVADAGPGIPPERRATLFQSSLSTRAGGAGIGLRHAAALARSLGGELRLADSEKGARFELSWPLVSEAAEHPVEAWPESHRAPTVPVAPVSTRGMPLAGTRILLVEDDDAVIDLLDTALTARGADVVSVRHRRDLDGALGTGPFDAALFDMSPIQDDVPGALARARATSDGLRVVMISGTAATLPSLPEGWISSWVRKPFEIGEILQAIGPATPR